MNYTLTNITSFFQVITKAHQIALTSSISILLILLSFGCSTKEAQKAELLVEKVIRSIEVVKDSLELNQLEGKWYYNNQPFNGFAVTYHDNKNLAESIGYYNGKKEGLAKKWFENGQLQKESFYIENQLNGVVKSWWPSQILSSESHYSKGVREGVQKRWYDNGQLSSQTNLKNGLEEGLQQAWLRNGKIYVNYEAKNGRVFGLKKANLCYKLENEIVQIK